MASETDHSLGEAVAARIERRWATLSIVIVGVLVGMAAYIGIHQATMPQGRVETADPKTLHLSGEFAEQNLGTSVGADGSVTTRIVATQFMFAPRCIAVPQGRNVTLRFTSPDVIHGILITGTNVNTMAVPGYVAQVHTEFRSTGDLLMPCHEYCGLGHSEMWATVQVLAENEFKPDRDGRVSCAKR